MRTFVCVYVKINTEQKSTLGSTVNSGQNFFNQISEVTPLSENYNTGFVILINIKFLYTDFGYVIGLLFYMPLMISGRHLISEIKLYYNYEISC